MDNKKRSKPLAPFRKSGALRILSVFFVLCAVPAPALSFEILMGTGEKGSFSYFAGRTICRVIEGGADGIDCKVRPAADGDVHNLTNLRSGSLDLCLVDSRMLQDAVDKKGEFRFLDIVYDNISLLMPVYEIPMTLVARDDAGVESLEDLKGKRINAGAPLSETRRATETVMAAKGWVRDVFGLVQELPTSQMQDTMAFCHGSVQAMVHVGVHPDSSLAKLLKLCEAKLVSVYDRDIRGWIDGHPAFCETTVDKGAYPSVSGQFETLATRGVLVASDSLDDDTATDILEAIYGGLDRLKRSHPSLSPPAKGPTAIYSGIPAHPGAARFFSQPVP